MCLSGGAALEASRDEAPGDLASRLSPRGSARPLISLRYLIQSLLVMSDIVSQYMLLKDRGQQIFDGLRDLPQFGKRLWEPYFRRAFDIYHKLWKFQQEHRSTLEAEYGLQRHEVHTHT